MVKVPARDPVAAQEASRHPMQILLLAAVALSGAGEFFNFGPPPTLLIYIPDYAVRLWGLINLTAGLLGLIGAIWPDRILGLLMERLALAALCLPTMIYGVLIFVRIGSPAWTAAVFAIGFGLACIVRVVQVSFELKRHRKWLDQHIHWDKGGRRD